MARTSGKGGLLNYGLISAGGDVTGGDKITITATPSQIDAALRPVADIVASAGPRDEAPRDEAERNLSALKLEAAKGDGADDQAVATLVDTLIELVPEAADAMTTAFTDPLLGRIAGSATRFVLGKLRGKRA